MKWIVRLGICLAVVGIYFAAWSYHYGGAMNPEPPKLFPLDGKGEILAQQHGWRYVQVNDPFLGQEYYSRGPESRENWNRFMDRINETAAQNESLLFGTFFLDGYNLQVIEQYWFVERKNGSLAISQLISPEGAYAVPLTEWGPLKFFSFGWRPRVTDNAIIFEKPSKEDLSFDLKFGGFFILLLGILVFIFGLMFGFIVAVFIWAERYKKKKAAEGDKTDIQNKNE
jgi:hypothetical protein